MPPLGMQPRRVVMLVAKQLLHSWERGMANETYNVITRRPIDEPLQEPPVSDPSKGKRQPKLDPKNPNESPFREPDARRPPSGRFQCAAQSSAPF